MPFISIAYYLKLFLIYFGTIKKLNQSIIKLYEILWNSHWKFLNFQHLFWATNVAFMWAK